MYNTTNKYKKKLRSIMFKWVELKINSGSTNIIFKDQNQFFYWPTELNISAYHSMSKRKKERIQNSLVLKLFYKHFCHFLPWNYVFEVQKTKERIDSLFSSNLFFQMPEGLGRYYGNLCKIFKKISQSVFSLSISCQVTYGACCIQDCLAKNFCSSILIHYGHSCLISILNCIVSVIYIFIEIKYDFLFLIQSIKGIFSKQRDRLMLTSTIQFSSELKLIKVHLSKIFRLLTIPQTKPLSPGEVLGCTSFLTKNQSGVIYIGDGKFHIESVLYFNPNIKIIQFNPFTRSLILIGFKFTEILTERENFIEKGVFFSRSCNFIFGGLGRQGNTKILKTLKFLAELKKMKNSIYITTEIETNRLEILSGNLNNLWVQLSCPRISLDWGFYFKNLVITPFEFSILTRSTKWRKNFIPMDFYSKPGKFWSSYSVHKKQFVVNIATDFYLLFKKYNYFKNFI